MGEFLCELWGFMRERKKFWLLPIVLVLLLFGSLVVLTQGSVVAPFIYTLFYSLFQMTLHSFLSHTTLIHTRNFTTIILTPRHPPYPLASNGLLRSAHQRRQTDTSLV